MENRRTREWNWVKIGAIGEITAAIVTLFTLGYIIWQNTQMQTLINQSQTLITGVQKLIEPASHAFLARADPLVVIQEYKWLHDHGKPPVSCENPPGGIFITFENVSGVPVAVEPSVKGEVAMGQKTFASTETLETAIRVIGESILPPNGVNGIALRSVSEFREKYPRLSGIGPDPKLNFTLQLVYRSLVTGKRYRYVGKMTIFDDCRNPDNRVFQRGPETREEL